MRAEVPPSIFDPSELEDLGLPDLVADTGADDVAVDAIVVTLRTTNTGPFEHIATFNPAEGVTHVKLGVVRYVVRETGMYSPGKAP